MDNNALNKISYGLFVLTTKDGEKENGCIINTVQLVTDNPKKISITVSKENFSHDILKKTKTFAVNVLTVDTPFSVFEKFGFSSGRNVDKFADCDYSNSYAENGLKILDKYINSYICGKIIDEVDLGSHTLFIADVTEAKVISDAESVTYDYYHKNIKPKVKIENTEKTKWVCQICNYVYEGENLPENFVCPWCKHSASDFKKI